jgi:hypothetical protein
MAHYTSARQRNAQEVASDVQEVPNREYTSYACFVFIASKHFMLVFPNRLSAASSTHSRTYSNRSARDRALRLDAGFKSTCFLLVRNASWETKSLRSLKALRDLTDSSVDFGGC